MTLEIPDNLSIPCPRCDTPLDITWLEVTAFDTTRKAFLPTDVRCPANPSHDVRSAYAELDWPASLTEEDREWLRMHARRLEL